MKPSIVKSFQVPDGVKLKFKFPIRKEEAWVDETKTTVEVVITMVCDVDDTELFDAIKQNMVKIDSQLTDCLEIRVVTTLAFDLKFGDLLFIGEIKCPKHLLSVCQ